MDYSFKLEEVRVEAPEGIDSFIAKKVFDAPILPHRHYTKDLNAAFELVKHVQETYPSLVQVDLCHDLSGGVLVIPLDETKHELEVTFKGYQNAAHAVSLACLMLLGLAKEPDIKTPGASL